MVDFCFSTFQDRGQVSSAMLITSFEQDYIASLLICFQVVGKREVNKDGWNSLNSPKIKLGMAAALYGNLHIWSSKDILSLLGSLL